MSIMANVCARLAEIAGPTYEYPNLAGGPQWVKAPTATLQFDRRVRLEFHGATITSDAGLLACRELDEALELT